MTEKFPRPPRIPRSRAQLTEAVGVDCRHLAGRVTGACELACSVSGALDLKRWLSLTG